MKRKRNLLMRDEKKREELQGGKEEQEGRGERGRKKGMREV